VLLVVKNLHWIDTETQALLESLVESLPTARLLLLVNYRPEYQHGWGSKTYYTQLRLDPLPHEDAQELLNALLGTDGELMPLKQRLIARTEGNPFFLEENVRALVEAEVLGGTPGAYRLVQALPTIQVPATVQAVLAARIDRLPPEVKYLLQTAAVIGHDVPLDLLQPIAESSEEALQRSLAQLQGAELLYETRLFPEREYTFKHALTHEVAYGSLLPERRRTLHRRILEVLEGMYADRLADQVDRLAHHALRGEVWDKAVAYCRQAGTKAITHSAYHEAVASFEQALDALQQLPASQDTRALAIDLRLDLRSALLPLGELGRIRVALQEAAALAETLGDHYRLGWLAAYLVAYCMVAGEPEQAIAFGQRALKIAAALGDVGLAVTAQHYLASIYRNMGDYHQAMAYSRKSMVRLQGELCQECFGMPGLASVLSCGILAYALAECGAFAEAKAPTEEGVRMAEAADHPYSRVWAYWTVGFCALRQGHLPEAIGALERALDLVHVADVRLQVPRVAASLGALFTTSSPLKLIRLQIPRVAASLGAAYALAGRTAEALSLLEQAVEQAMAMRFLADLALRVTWLGEAYLLVGRLDDAYAQAQRALAFARAHQERGHEAYGLRLLGELMLQRDPPAVEQAETYYRQAFVLAEALGMRPLVAHCHRGLGTLYATIGRPEQARAELTSAIDLYHSMDMIFWRNQAQVTLAQT
jgi:tetratricopeptide (TPR) repeat protein